MASLAYFFLGILISIIAIYLAYIYHKRKIRKITKGLESNLNNLAKPENNKKEVQLDENKEERGGFFASLGNKLTGRAFTGAESREIESSSAITGEKRIEGDGGNEEENRTAESGYGIIKSGELISKTADYAESGIPEPKTGGGVQIPSTESDNQPERKIRKIRLHR